MEYNKKEEDDHPYPLQNIDKIQVLQETRVFNETPIKPRHCVFLITKLLYCLGQGEIFSATEATDIFFNLTKLFISEDPKLRRMLYLGIRELSRYAEQVFVASNSLVKDMNSNLGEEYKANAIRTLRTITDVSMFGTLDRHLKQAVVDQSASVASAALLTGLHLTDVNLELVKKWTNELQSALKNRYHMVQYHALALAYKLRHQDALAVSKLVSSNISNFRSPLAHTLLIKYAVRVLIAENNPESERTVSILKYLDTCLSYRNDMIVLESAKALCSLQLSPKELTPAVTALQAFLSSGKPVQRFAAIQVLNKLAAKYPALVSLCNTEMEGLVTDANRNIATLAITTLLKTGNESNIDRLMKQITRFMSDMPDEFKVIVVQAIRALCLKYPQKHHSMLSFLSNGLREEGSYDYKKSIVDTIITIIEQIPDSKENGIDILCEFIEDCEFTLLLQQVLHFLGEEGPKSQKPSKCIRYIYNRVILESAPVRASAVISLAKFAASVPSLRPSIYVILQRTLQDNDDEVRDRAVFYLQVLRSENEDQIRKLILEGFHFNVKNLEKSLSSYLNTSHETPFDITDVPVADEDVTPVSTEEVEHPSSDKQQARATTPTTTAPSSAIEAESYENLLANVPQLAKMGAPFKSSRPVSLTEGDADYVVNCIKHIYKDYVVFQFNVKNKVESQRLKNIVVEMDIKTVEGLDDDIMVKALTLPYNATEAAFVRMRITEPGTFPVGSLSNTLKFTVLDADQDDDEDAEGDEDEFDLEDISLTIGDYLRNSNVSFKEEWEGLGEDNESVTDFIPYSNRDDLQDSIDRVISTSGLKSMNDPKVPPNKKVHTIFFAGKFTTGNLVLVQAQLGEKNKQVLMKLAVRAENEELRNKVLEALSSKSK
jgi:coatomer protein complex subunit gamma